MEFDKALQAVAGLSVVDEAKAKPYLQALSEAFATLKAESGEATGAGAAALGANSPAITLAAPYKWLKAKTDDGSVVFIPAWK